MAVELATSSESVARQVQADCPDASLLSVHCSEGVGCSPSAHGVGLGVAALMPEVEVVEPSSSRSSLGRTCRSVDW